MPTAGSATAAWTATGRERSVTMRRDEMGTIDEEDEEVGKRVISFPRPAVAASATTRRCRSSFSPLLRTLSIASCRRSRRRRDRRGRGRGAMDKAGRSSANGANGFRIE